MNDPDRLDTPMSSPDLDELLGAFALDAIEGDERERVAEYVATNAAARREVDELRETAALLALAPTDLEVAPAALWGRIAATVDAQRAAEIVTPIDARRTRRTVPLRWAAAGAVAAALALVAMSVRLSGDATRSDLATAFDRAARSGSTMELAGATTVKVALDDGQGVMRTDALPPLGDGEVYQAWAVYRDVASPISIAVFSDDTDYAAFRYGDDLAALAITVERSPGVVSSQETPIAVAELP